MAMAQTDAVYKTEQDVGAQNGPPEDAQTMQELPESTADEPPKKRRRVVKPNPDKKFECKHEGCGKSYSRAEHLYRHQLNRKLYFHVVSASLTPFEQTLQRPSFAVTTQTVTGTLFGRTYAFVTESDIQLMDLNFINGIPSPSLLLINPCKPSIPWAKVGPSPWQPQV